VAEQRREAWQEMIDQYLVEWGRDPAALEDEGVIPPSRRVINRASTLAMLYRDSNNPAPSRVVPNGDGGIVFERGDRSWFQVIEIHADCSVELISFKSSRLVSRRRLD